MNSRTQPQLYSGKPFLDGGGEAFLGVLPSGKKKLAAVRARLKM
jgi:hypothetical protein